MATGVGTGALHPSASGDAPRRAALAVSVQAAPAIAAGRSGE